MQPPPLPGPQPSPTDCPKCGKEMRLVERSSMSGDDMRTYRCGRPARSRNACNFSRLARSNSFALSGTG